MRRVRLPGAPTPPGAATVHVLVPIIPKGGCRVNELSRLPGDRLVILSRDQPRRADPFSLLPPFVPFVSSWFTPNQQKRPGCTEALPSPSGGKVEEDIVGRRGRRSSRAGRGPTSGPEPATTRVGMPRMAGRSGEMLLRFPSMAGWLDGWMAPSLSSPGPGGSMHSPPITPGSPRTGPDRGPRGFPGAIRGLSGGSMGSGRPSLRAAWL